MNRHTSELAAVRRLLRRNRPGIVSNISDCPNAIHSEALPQCPRIARQGGTSPAAPQGGAPPLHTPPKLWIERERRPRTGPVEIPGIEEQLQVQGEAEIPPEIAIDRAHVVAIVVTHLIFQRTPR